MMEIMPDWYNKAEEKLNECINDIIRDNYIDWAFSHDSETINSSKRAILQALVTISQQVNNPFQLKKPDAESFNNKIKIRKKGKRAKYSRYSEEEDNFILENYNNMTMKELAERLNRSFFSIGMRIKNLGIRKNGNNINNPLGKGRFTKREDKFILKNMNKMSQSEIARHLNRRQSAIWGRMQRIKIPGS